MGLKETISLVLILLNLYVYGQDELNTQYDNFKIGKYKFSDISNISFVEKNIPFSKKHKSKLDDDEAGFFSADYMIAYKFDSIVIYFLQNIKYNYTSFLRINFSKKNNHPSLSYNSVNIKIGSDVKTLKTLFPNAWSLYIDRYDDEQRASDEELRFGTTLYRGNKDIGIQLSLGIVNNKITSLALYIPY